MTYFGYILNKGAHKHSKLEHYWDLVRFDKDGKQENYNGIQSHSKHKGDDNIVIIGALDELLKWRDEFPKPEEEETEI